MSTSSVKVVDLFCGAGGASLGFAQAGFEVCGAVDIYEQAIETYKQNLCGTDLSEKGINGQISFDKPMNADLTDKSFADIRDYFDLDPGEVDIICGCPPCQNFSTLRDTDPWPADEPKDTLLRAFVEHIRDAQPQMVFFENVPGIMTAGDGDHTPTTYVDWFRSAMESIGTEGYGVDLRVLNAADFGVPQRRRRTVGICVYGADGDDITFPPQTHAQNPLPDSEQAEWKSVQQTLIEDTPDLKTDLGAGETQVGIDGYPDDGAHRARRHQQKTIKLIKTIRKHGNSWTDLQDTADEDLIRDCHQNLSGGSATAAYGIIRPDEPAPTLTTRCTNISSGRFTHPTENRAITFREAALLMTFPRWFTLPTQNSHAERVVGNAVPPAMVERIASELRSLRNVAAI